MLSLLCQKQSIKLLPKSSGGVCIMRVSIEVIAQAYVTTLYITIY